MAKCKRCGTAFDYEKREGVCPRCCFYNRPQGSSSMDDQWMKNYNIEENSYEPPRVSMETISADKILRGGDIEDRNGRYRKKKNKENTYKRRQNKRPRSLMQKIINVVALLCIGAVFLSFILSSDAVKSYRTMKSEKTSKLLPVETISPEMIAEGVKAGDVTYRIGEAKTLFKEGELASLPEGEKCIGIWIEDNETVVSHYTSYGWKRPYVFDGKYFREMVNADILDEADKFTEKGIDTFPEFLSSYEDVSAYAIFFVDAEARSVTISLPCQTVNQDDSSEKEYNQVIDVEIPINE